MKLTNIKLPIFDFTVTYIEIETKNDYLKALPHLLDIKVSEEDCEEIKDRIERGCYNGGDTFRNLELKAILVLIYPCESKAKKQNIIAHEMRHVVDRICEHLHITDIETPAYISGFLAEKMYTPEPVVKAEPKTTTLTKKEYDIIKNDCYFVINDGVLDSLQKTDIQPLTVSNTHKYLLVRMYDNGARYAVTTDKISETRSHLPVFDATTFLSAVDEIY